ncbi:hypothetical protein, partial [Enterococcus sp. HMSC076E04]|uniref:hypothetical protein n=1 Tax=Enterococcus sp. HMSC076E04 TaxID=1739465 RepID=UPI001C403CD3
KEATEVTSKNKIPSKAIIPITKKDRFDIHILPLTLIFAEFLKKQIFCYFIATLLLLYCSIIVGYFKINIR